MCGGMDPRCVEIHPDLGHPRQRREARRPRSAQPKPAPLLISEILTAWEIAQHLNISANTAKHHISEAMKKLKVKNRKDLKQYMLR